MNDYAKYPELYDRYKKAHEGKNSLLKEHAWAKQYTARRSAASEAK